MKVSFTWSASAGVPFTNVFGTVTVPAAPYRGLFPSPPLFDRMPTYRTQGKRSLNFLSAEHARIKEIPFFFVDRTRGTSKLNFRIGLEALWVVWWLRIADALGRL